MAKVAKKLVIPKALRAKLTAKEKRILRSWMAWRTMFWKLGASYRHRVKQQDKKIMSLLKMGTA